MSCTRSKIVAQAKAWLGLKESDGSHKKIIDIYNAHKPLARGYKVLYTDAWCATTVSAMAIACGATDIIPTECGCGEMVELLQAMGIWVEADDYIPAPGDLIFYDWQDSGKGDDKGWPDHVGMVEKVSSGIITAIEGNYSNSVKRRIMTVDGKYIRGYGVPKYDQEEPASRTESDYTLGFRYLRIGSKGEDVKAVQRLLIAAGYSCGSYGADGDFGNATRAALILFQTKNGLGADGVVGPKTMAKLLGVSA